MSRRSNPAPKKMRPIIHRNPSSQSGLTDTDRKRLAAGGARGGDYGPNAVAVFGGNDGDPAAVVEYVRGKWTVSVIDEYGRHRGSKTYASRATAFREAQFDESNIAFANPAPKNIDHKFAGSLFSVDPTLAMGYLRGSMSKGTARDLAKAKLSKAKRRSNPSRREMTKAEALREFRSAYPAGSFLMSDGRLDRVMAREAWSNFTDSLHRDGRITDTQVDQWGVPPQFSSVRSAMSRRSNPDWSALSAKAREKAKSAYARAKPHAARGLALAKVGAARAGAAVKRGSKKAAPHVARGFRSLSERLDRFAVSNPRKRTRTRR